MSHFYDDEHDISDLKREAAAERKAANAYCPECKCVGYHASGCPEAAEADEKGERGYGNAIVPQVAAEFVQAFCEAHT